MNTIGSLWNKWDLHIHTDASDGKGSCEEILREAKSKGIRCIAVTDHHTVGNVDIMKQMGASMGIVVISGVEFRTEYGKSSVHMIGLFPDEYNSIKLSAEFLNENVLNPLGISRTVIIQKGREYSKEAGLADAEYFKIGMFLVQVDFKEAADRIHEFGGLVTVHAGSKSNSIDKEMRHEGSGPKNVSIEDSLGPVKEELFRKGYIDICDLQKPKDALFYRSEFGKPSITTSDAHEIKDVGVNACWIKADPTFEGLRQIITEPERVSFADPDILKRIRLNPDKFIQSLVIRRATNATMTEKWFDNIVIPLNPGLVAIIGNKGSGKSALTDIIALCADTTNQNWSFLTPFKFRMSKPFNRAKQTEAFVHWADGSCSTIKTLDMPSDVTQPERVKYIPQNFLETLCTTENDNEFENELKKIIFQYLDPTQRFGLNDLDSIIDYLTRDNHAVCCEIESRIKSINQEIIELEAMLTPDYKIKLENELKYRQDQLENAKRSEPEDVTKPSIENNPAAKQVKEDVERLELTSKQILASLGQLSESLENLVKTIHELGESKDRLDRLVSNVEATKTELQKFFELNGLDIYSVISLAYSPQIISSKISELVDQRHSIEKEFDATVPKSLKSQYLEVLSQLEEAKKKLSEPELRYQKYLKEKEEWGKMVADIIGSPEKDGTIKNLQSRIQYIEEDLVMELSEKRALRKQYVLELMQKKQEVLNTYNSLFAPIVQFIKDYQYELREYPIEFDSAFAIRNFDAKLFDYVSQQSAGSYYGKEQGMIRVKDNIESVDLSSIQSIVDFACLINDDLLRDKRDMQNATDRIVESQLKKGHTKKDLYDFIYCMEYIVPFFQLKMNGKPLESLSPGERGALLLLLYLFIDMDDKPLIIDQPEENLDNESVYKYLVHFIRAAKKKRQIIMVTHNPNLAVVCDADQVIQMKIDKIHDNEVSFISGPIEDPVMNRIIVDILEGSYPAFHYRDCKYFDKNV